MLWVSCVGLWFALSASYALSAGIIGMPAGVIAFGIANVTLWVVVGAVAVFLARALIHEWRRSDDSESSA